MKNETLEECYVNCKKTFNFNKQYVNKLIKKSNSLENSIPEDNFIINLNYFAEKIYSLYGETLSKFMTNIIINKKTLRQHMMNNTKSLNSLLKYFEEAKNKSKNITLIKTEIDPIKIRLRTINIGKIG